MRFVLAFSHGINGDNDSSRWFSDSDQEDSTLRPMVAMERWLSTVGLKWRRKVGEIGLWRPEVEKSSAAGEGGIRMNRWRLVISSIVRVFI